MLGLADETWLALVGMVLSFAWNVIQAWQTRSRKADASDAMIAIARGVLAKTGDPLVLDEIRRKAVEASTRPQAAHDLDTSMRVVISESQRMQAFGKRGL